MNSLKKALAVFGTATGAMVLSLSFALININLERIHVSLGATLVQLQWMINIYGIFLTSLLVTMGRLGDRFGRRRIFLIGLSLFSLSMIGASVCQTPGMLIFYMGIYGISGAILLPLSQALLVGLFSKDQKGLAVGIWAAANGVSFTIGTLCGGVLLTYFSWQILFLINVPLAALGIALTRLFCGEFKSDSRSNRMDWAGVILLTLAVAAFVLATVQWNLWDRRIGVFLYLLSAASLVGLLIVEKKVSMPIIEEDLFKSRMFLFCCMGNASLIGIYWAGLFLIPLYLQKVMGLGATQTGLIMLAFSLPQTLISPVVGQIYRSIGAKPLLWVGFSAFAFASIMQLQFTEAASVFWITSSVLLLGIGFAMAYAPSTAGALSSATSEFAGVASGTLMTIQEVGGNVGLAIAATAARGKESFAAGFQQGVWVLMALSCIGLVSAFFVPKKSAELKQRN